MKLMLAVSAALALLAPHALATEQAGGQGETSFTRSRVRTVSATVTALDQKTRMVTLKSKDGSTVSFRVDDKVKNLGQVKVGDVVTADYYESVAIYVSKPGGEGASSGVTTTVTTAKPGEMPGAIAENEVTLVSTVEAIASDRKSVTLKKADGSTLVLPVKNPANLDGVHVGDQVTIIASEALAVSVERSKAKPPASGGKKKK